MNRKEKAAWIKNVLDERFPTPSIPLQHVSPYTLLIAVLLSAQCTDARVNQVTPTLFAKADTPEKMIKLSPEEIKQAIQSLGLAPTKARAIWELSHQLIDRYQGKVPQTFIDLESLPGVGHKTASVVLSQAFGIPAFPVDTHIHRCATRWGLTSGENVRETEKDLKELFPKKTWNLLHLQIIYFARSYCTAKKHKVKECPICSHLA